MGKTRLSLEVATRLHDAFQDGVFFVPLASVLEADLVASAIAQALGVTEEKGRSLVERLKQELRALHCLLVLDNFEHLLKAGALIDELLTSSSGMKVLVTSRAALRLSGEHDVVVPPMALPDLADLPPIAELAANASVALFTARARAVHETFALTAANALPVAAICVHLDGLPLAIELAAARSKLLGPQALLMRLVQRFSLLTGGARNRPSRHQTLKNALDWSHDLLRDDERRVFAWLGVFAGSWTVEAAEHVAGDAMPIRHPTLAPPPPATSGDVLDAIAGLLDQSLLQQTINASGEQRLAMLETIRMYALERLTASGAAAAARLRHADYFLRLVELAEPELVGVEQAGWLARLEHEHDNLRAALGWLREAGEGELGLRMAGALWRFWFMRGYLSEGRAWIESMLVAKSCGGVQAGIRAKALTGAGILAAEQGDFRHAAALAEQSLHLYQEVNDTTGSAGALTILGSVLLREGAYARAASVFADCLTARQQLGDPRGIATALNNLGLVARARGHYRRAATLYEQSLHLKQGLGDRRGIALALNNLGDVALDRRDYTHAAVLFEQSLALFREQGEQWGIALLLTNLGNVARRQGRLAHAADLYLEGLALYRSMGTKPDASEALEGLASVAYARGEPRRATQLAAAAATLRQRIGAPLLPRARTAYNRTLVELRAAVGENTFAEAWTVGSAMSLDEAIDCGGSRT